MERRSLSLESESDEDEAATRLHICRWHHAEQDANLAATPLHCFAKHSRNDSNPIAGAVLD